MKKGILILFCLVLATSFYSCSKKCKGESPRARIVNDGNKKADVQVKTTGGNTININNVLPKTTSEFASYDAGIVTFTANVDSTQLVKAYNVEDCYDYDIVINSADSIYVVANER